MAKIIIDIPDEDYKELIKDKDFILRTKNPWKTVIVNGKALSDGATNGDVIKAIFPNVITEEFCATIHATTKVNCCGDKGCKGSISYDFWKDWWDSPYKEVEHEVKICDTCAHYGEDLHGANCRFCSDQKLWEPKEE